MSQPDERQPEISIIVAVYNVEKYVEDCLEAIAGQTFTDWECIVVDDGSPDRSGEICDRIAARDPRFRVLHTANGGVSAARNRALATARGRYIEFVDPDDYPLPNYLERLHAVAVEYDADVVECGIVKKFDGYERTKLFAREVTVLDRRGVALGLLDIRRIPGYMWCKLFRREVIDTPFPEGHVFEDIWALSHWVRNIHRMVIIPEALYVYRQRGGSIVNTHTVSNCLDYQRAMMNLVDALHGIEPETVDDTMVRQEQWRAAVRAARNIARGVDDPCERLEGIIAVRKRIAALDPDIVLGLGFKTGMRARMLLHNPRMFIFQTRFTGFLNIIKRFNKSRRY